MVLLFAFYLFVRLSLICLDVCLRFLLLDVLNIFFSYTTDDLLLDVLFVATIQRISILLQSSHIMDVKIKQRRTMGFSDVIFKRFSETKRKNRLKRSQRGLILGSGCRKIERISANIRMYNTCYENIQILVSNCG